MRRKIQIQAMLTLKLSFHFHALIRLAIEIFYWTMMLYVSHSGQPRSGAQWPNPDRGKQSTHGGWRRMSIPITTNRRYHDLLQVEKGKNITIPAFLAEVRLVFKPACPGSSPCPAVRHDVGLRGKGFPETLSKAELSTQKGVWAAGPTLGGIRLLSCKQASQRIPVHRWSNASSASAHV